MIKAEYKNQLKQIKELRAAVENSFARSAWDKGVKLYALELLDKYYDDALYCAKDDENIPQLTTKVLLRGASNWKCYSHGGCSLCFDKDIAERLCNASELKRCKGGLLDPNPNEDWIDAQARALSQAANLLLSLKK